MKTPENLIGKRFYLQKRHGAVQKTGVYQVIKLHIYDKSQDNYDCAIAQLVLKNGSLSKAVYGKVCLPFSWFTKEVSK